MAAILEHGGHLYKGVTMHPFFQPGKSLVLNTAHSNPQIDRDHPQSTQTSTHNDLNPERKPPIPPRFSIEIPAYDPIGRTSDEHVKKESADASQITNSTDVDLDGDLNHGRKKRRKLSSENTLETSGSREGVDSVLLQSQPACSRIPTAAKPPNLTATTRKVDSGIDLEQPVIVEAQSQNLDGAAEGKHQNTPKKNVLRIGSNGKLTKSPRRSPRQAKVESLSVNKSSKKVELKNGRFVSSMHIKLAYGASESSRKQIGEKIQEILFKPSIVSLPPKAAVRTIEDKGPGDGPTKITHPFFLGKVAPKPALEITTLSEEKLASTNVSDDEISRSQIQAKPWQDIKFSSNKISRTKTEGRLQPLWPPIDLHRIEPERQVTRPSRPESPAPKNKSRRLNVGVDNSEDVIARLSQTLKLRQLPPQVMMPQRWVTTSEALLQNIRGPPGSDTFNNPNSQHPAIVSLSSRIKTRKTAFERGVAADSQIWPIEYSPKSWQEVLQPQCREMYEWLKALKVHNVQKTSEEHSRSSSRSRIKKKKAKQRSADLDDFLVDSDEDDIDTKHVQNVVVIVGPSGCGKTASVLAVARQLEFEVFEINPGTRRSAKDIFDRVGDVTRNHLVQRVAPRLQQPLASANDNFLTGPEDIKVMPERVGRMKPEVGQIVEKTKVANQSNLQSGKESIQKQSLILFEEVDLLFDDDKSFWTGVQSLAQQSRRPIVLTCNNITSVPLDQLNIHSILEYDNPPTGIAVELLVHLAAAEGHLIDREAIELLYRSRRHDLRASITELNFWCQMTVGSQQGGLDWMLPSASNEQRIASKNTYTAGLDLVPTVDLERTDLLQYLQDSLDLSVEELEFSEMLSLPSTTHAASALASIQAMSSIADARSVLALMDEQTSAKIADAIDTYCPMSRNVLDRKTVARLNTNRLIEHQYDRRNLQDILFSLNDDPRIFPAPVGRPGPSIDSTSVSLATEIAPYVRAIVSHEQHRAMIREALEGTDGKRARKTRAARAALEGGDKSMTRREQWFPKGLKLEAVLGTRSKFIQENTILSMSQESRCEDDIVPASTASTIDEMIVEA